jgi:methionyl aminopeptidase
MGIIKTKSQIENIKIACRIVAEVLEMLKEHVKEGITSLEIDTIVEKYIRKQGGTPCFKGWYDFPNATCISINEEVIHGIPNKRTIRDGDLVSIDLGVDYKGGIGDSAYTYLVGDVKEEHTLLANRTQESLYKGIEQATIGNRVGDIGNAVQTHVEQFEYGIVREYCGHGVGESLWEEPQIPNYGKKNRGKRLKENMCICIEPMINLGGDDVYVKDDNWTVVTADGEPSAHYEAEILITKNGPEILTKL